MFFTHFRPLLRALFVCLLHGFIDGIENFCKLFGQKPQKELGRETTDTLLKRVAGALQESCPDESCLIGRLNGAVFAVLAPDVDSVEEGEHRGRQQEHNRFQANLHFRKLPR